MPKATLSRLALGLLLGIFLLSSPLFAQPPESPPEIQSQVRDGVRMRLKRAYWDIPQKLHSQLNYPGKGLVIDYEAEHAYLLYSGDLHRAITDIRVQGPNGEAVASNSLEEKNRIFLSDVNPHWSHLLLDFEVQTSPDAQKLAQGRKTSEVSFHNLPFPRRLNQPVTLDQTRTTDWGTRVTLQTIVLRPLSKRNKTPVYHLTFRLETRSDADDLTFNLWNSRAGFIDLYGNDISGLSPRRKSENDETHPASRTQQQWEFSIPQSAFAAQDIANGLGFKLRLEEWSPRRRQVEGFLPFHFKLPLAGLADNTPVYQPPAQFAQPARPVHISAEAWPAEQPGVVTLRLWARPSAANVARGWIIKSAQSLERRQPLLREKPPFYRPGRSGWKASGPAAMNENSADFRWPLKTPQESLLQPQVHTLKLELEEARHAAYQFQFDGLPCPRDKAVSALNRVARSDVGAQLAVLAVGSYQNNQLPAGWPVAATPQVIPPVSSSGMPFLPSARGIAVACRWTPAGGSDTVQATHRITARDRHGRALLDQPLDMLLPTAPEKWPIDEFVQATEREPDTRKEHYDFTLFLLPPADDAQSFDLSFSMQETITTGKQESVVFSLPSRELSALPTAP